MQMGTIRVFCDVVRTKNFTRAAEWNDRTQSHVSNLVLALEAEFGVRLAERRPGFFQLTPAGEILHRHFLEILRLNDEMERRMQETRAAAAGIIELAACYSIGLHQLPPCLNRFRRNRPRVDIRVRYNLIYQVHEEVLANAVHLGLVCYPRRLPGLVIDIFRHERLVLVCHPRHPLAACQSVTFSGLTGQHFVAWTEIRASPLMKDIPNHLRHHFEPAHEFHEAEMVKRVVEMGAGIAILPEAIVRSEVAGRRLAAVLFANGCCTEPLGIIYRENTILTPAMKDFIQFLKQPTVAAN